MVKIVAVAAAILGVACVVIKRQRDARADAALWHEAIEAD